MLLNSHGVIALEHQPSVEHVQRLSAHMGTKNVLCDSPHVRRQCLQYTDSNGRVIGTPDEAKEPCLGLISQQLLQLPAVSVYELGEGMIVMYD